MNSQRLIMSRKTFAFHSRIRMDFGRSFIPGLCNSLASISTASHLPRHLNNRSNNGICSNQNIHQDVLLNTSRINNPGNSSLVNVEMKRHMSTKSIDHHRHHHHRNKYLCNATPELMKQRKMSLKSGDKHIQQHTSSTITSSRSPRNDFAEDRKQKIETQERIRDLLNDIGVSRWQIRDNHSPSSSSPGYESNDPRNSPTNSHTNTGSHSSSSYTNNHSSSNHFSSSHHSNFQHDITARLPVKSYHAANSIDIVNVLTKVFHPLSSQSSQSPNDESVPLRHMVGKSSVVVQLPPIYKEEIPPPPPYKFKKSKYNKHSASSTTTTTKTKMHPNDFFHPHTLPRYISVHDFGSVVFFNVRTKDATTILNQIKQYSTEPIAKGFERREHFEVAISPTMSESAHVSNGDYATVPELDYNVVKVISSVMAQTVALDSYNDTVDELLAKFAKINTTVKQEGNFMTAERGDLFRVVAMNNSLFIDMVAKLGIKDRSVTAWDFSQYERVHEGMKEEFEINNRFNHIEFKLDLIQQNAKFFLEVIHSQKSNSLEYIIIVLIAFECVLMILEMSGIGGTILKLPFDLWFTPSTPEPVISPSVSASAPSLELDSTPPRN